MEARAVLVLLAVLASRAPLWGQAEPPPPPLPAASPTLTITLSSDVPRIQATNLLEGGGRPFVTLMSDGFPLRLHYRLELWRRRTNWFDAFQRDASWDVVVQQDPITGDYILTRSAGAGAGGRYRTLEELSRALAIPYQVTLAPAAGARGRFYFVTTLEAETLSDSDIDEVLRWLRGDVSPAVSGEGNIGAALSRGAQRLLVRLAGLPRLQLEARSDVFERQ